MISSSFFITLGVFFGLLLGIHNGLQSLNEKEWIDEIGTPPIGDSSYEESLARPYKVPGPQSLCPSKTPKMGDTNRITYIESSGEECLTPRQACGIESSARLNPHLKIILYFNTMGLVSPPRWDDGMRRAGRVRSCVLNRMLVSNFPQIEVVHQNFTELLQNTDFWPIVEDGSLTESQWSVVQLSDAVRLILLQKQGGFYLDFDTINFRPLHCLRNSLSYLEEVPNIENSVMVMDAGHPFLAFLIRFLAENFLPEIRTSLGPDAIGKAFKIFCRVNEPTLKAGTYQCQGNSTVTLIHPNAYFPVRHTQIYQFYSVNFDDLNIEAMQQAYVTHVYLSSWGTPVDRNSLYARLARQYCPTVWEFATSYVPLGF